jgi:hypothetical protein
MLVTSEKVAHFKSFAAKCYCKQDIKNPFVLANPASSYVYMHLSHMYQSMWRDKEALFSGWWFPQDLLLFQWYLVPWCEYVMFQNSEKSHRVNNASGGGTTTDLSVKKKMYRKRRLKNSWLRVQKSGGWRTSRRKELATARERERKA